MSNDQGIKSRPVYGPLTRDPSGRRHLLLIEDSAVLVPGAAAAAHAYLSGFEERWSIVGNSRALPGNAAVPMAGDHAYRSLSHLLIALRHRLARETMGLRLYALGREPFIWDVYGIASRAGLSRGEMHFAHHGDWSRRVFCVHCRTMTSGVQTNLVACSGCGATLFVRDHFSRHLAAYMGVQADSENPGDLPPAETLYV